MKVKEVFNFAKFADIAPDGPSNMAKYVTRITPQTKVDFQGKT